MCPFAYLTYVFMLERGVPFWLLVMVLPTMKGTLLQEVLSRSSCLIYSSGNRTPSPYKAC